MEAFQCRLLKALLRNKLRQSLRLIPEVQRKKRSQKIISKLMQTKVFQRSKNIFTYVALPDEVQTESLIWKSVAVRKNIFVPKINPRNKRIRMFQITNPLKDLKRGSFGIPEPKAKGPRAGNPKILDLVVVPGLGFDRRKGRLGRGEGYFDRFLKKTGRARKVGLAFGEQIVDFIPMQTHDVRVHQIISG